MRSSYFEKIECPKRKMVIRNPDICTGMYPPYTNALTANGADTPYISEKFKY